MPPPFSSLAKICRRPRRPFDRKDAFVVFYIFPPSSLAGEKGGGGDGKHRKRSLSSSVQGGIVYGSSR